MTRLTKNFIFISLIIFICLSINTAKAQVDDSLVLHLIFDEGENDTVMDYSNYNNDGSIKGDPKWVDGKSGFALQFDGSDDSVEIPHADSLNMTDAVTIEMWVKLDADGPNSNQVGIEKGGWEAGEYSLYAFYVPGNGTAMQFKDLPENCGDANSGHLGQNIKDGKWHHIAGSWDGNTINIYTDGELDDSWECNGGNLAENSKSIYVAARNGNDRLLKGVVDEIRVYNRSLSQAEIQSDMETFGPSSAISPSEKVSVCWGKLKYTPN